ncbi:MAG: winged helix-turn-helix domain-containing protein [Candidatus Nitrosopolaris sp.]
MDHLKNLRVRIHFVISSMTNQETTITQHYTRNRSRLDVIASILRVVSAREASKTRIMYGAYVSYAQIREYMPSMLENSLLTTTNEQQSLYKIREKGMRFLELYEGLNEMIAMDKRDWAYE